MIRYYIPADGDDAAHPNIFHLPLQGRQVQRRPTLRDVRQNFPLPGAYHFRFKTRLGDPGKAGSGGGPVVWMDVTEDAVEVPSFDNGLILAKVTRLSAAAPPATAAGNHTAGAAASAAAQGDDLLGMGAGSRGSGRVAAAAASAGVRPASSAQQQSSSSAAKRMGGGGGIHQAPEADPFGLFAESSAGASTAVAPSRPQQQPPQAAAPAGGRSGADLLNFDAFGAPAPAPMMQPRPMMGGPGGRMCMSPPQQQPGPGIMGGMPPRGGMPRGPPYPPTGSSGGGWM